MNATQEAMHPLAWLWTISLGWHVLALPSSGASAGLLLVARYVCSFRPVQGLALGWCLEGSGGLGPSPTLLTGPSLPKHPAWRARPGGCRSQGCHGCPTRSAIVLPYLSGHLPQAHLLLMSLMVRNTVKNGQS